MLRWSWIIVNLFPFPSPKIVPKFSKTKIENKIQINIEILINVEMIS